VLKGKTKNSESSNFAWNSDREELDQEEDDYFQTKRDCVLISSPDKSPGKRVHYLDCSACQSEPN
jgi:hypothetical protein